MLRMFSVLALAGFAMPATALDLEVSVLPCSGPGGYAGVDVEADLPGGASFSGVTNALGRVEVTNAVDFGNPIDIETLTVRFEGATGVWYPFTVTVEYDSSLGDYVVTNVQANASSPSICSATGSGDQVQIRTSDH
ncbi:MAG: hypothetical protein R3B81_02170 [bacterium]